MWIRDRHGIESNALALLSGPPGGTFMLIGDTAAAIELPMERPLHSPAVKPKITNLRLESGNADIDASALFDQVIVDKAQLARNVRHALQDRSQITLLSLIHI